MHGNTLFNQSKEEHAAMSGLPAVEPERKFVQISLQVIFFEGSLMRSHQPALNERRDTVYARQNLIGILARAFDGRSLVDVIIFSGTGIGCQPVGVDGRARFDMLLNKGLERFSFGFGDDLQPATPKAFGGEQFHGDRHQYFASGAAPALAVPDATKDSLIHFDVSGQHVVPGMADCAPEPVQHCPSRRVGAKSKNSMQCFGGNAIFSGGQMPGGRKPYGQRCSGVMKDRTRRGGNATDASLAPPPSAFHAPGRGAATIWANKALWPANPIEIVEACSIIVKPSHKFGVVARVVNPGAGQGRSHLRCF